MNQNEAKIQHIGRANGYLVTITKTEIEFVGDYSLDYPPIRSQQKIFPTLKSALEFIEWELK